MNEVRLTIGGICLTLAGGASVERAMRLPGMATFATPRATAATASIKLDANLRPGSRKLLHSFELADGGLTCLFGIDAEGVYHYEIPGHGLVRFDARHPDIVECSGFEDAGVLRYALWTAYSMLGLWHEAVPVHASVAVWRGHGVLCLGESGTGKSTHTRLWLAHIEGSHLLNDDSPILSTAGGTATVYGSPWSGKTPCYLSEAYPVAGLVRLEQKSENSIRRLGTLEAFAALQPSCPPCLMKEVRLQDRLVAFVEQVIQCVPLYLMGCRPDPDAARLCHGTLFAS